MKSIEKIMKYEMLTGSIITTTNNVIGVLAFIPALLCFLFTASAFSRTGYSGTDGFPNPAASVEEKVLFSIASLLLISFYYIVLKNLFSTNKNKLNKRARLFYWLQVISVNLLALVLFIYFMGEEFVPDSFPPENVRQLVVYIFIYVPFIPLIISMAGCCFNLIQNNQNTNYYEN